MPNFNIDCNMPPDISERFIDFSSVFIIYGCVLLEKYTGKSYVYKAANIQSGDMAYICRRKNELGKADYEAVAEKIRVCGVADNSMDVEGKTEIKNTHEKLLTLQTVIFEKLLPEHGYGIREKQIELANHMLTAINGRVISLSEAEVGTGKTHAYIIASILTKRSRINDFWIRSLYPLSVHFSFDTPMPAVISTSSIALQKAISADYIPEISGIFIEHGVLKKPISCVIRKGKEHYICDMRLRAYVDFVADSKTAILLRPLLNKDYFHIDLGEMDGITPFVKRQINVTGRCNGKCPAYEQCRYMRFLKHAQSSKHDFQVCNHNYLLADTLKRAKGQRPLIPNYQLIIIDEAHKFLQAARQMYGLELSSLELPRIAAHVSNFTFYHNQSTAVVQSHADRLAAQSGELFALLNKNIPALDEYGDDTERFKTVIDKQAFKLLRSIGYAIDGLTAALRERTVIKKYENLCSYVIWAMGDIQERIGEFKRYQDIIYWLEIPKQTRSSTNEILLCAIPKRLNKLLYNDLWSKRIPVILTSGTLSVGGSFEHIKQNMGLDMVLNGGLTETSKPSPFNHKENTLLYISENMPFPDNKDRRYIEAVAREMNRLIGATHGHTAALFTSYKVMELVFEMLKSGGLAFPLIKLDRGGVTAIERFRHSGNGVLFASGSLWEGIDLPGDILSSLIIVKLPFAVPDPISEYEQSLYASMDDYKNGVIVPEMILKLKQGFGRLLRRETDTGVVSILDSRVRMGGAYRQRVLNALPDCRVTGNIEDVKRFIRQKKDDEYFR